VTISGQLLGIIVMGVVQLLGLAVAWGHLQRQVKDTRERLDDWREANSTRQDERHAENQEMLHEISGDVKRINGTVARHNQVLLTHGEEINRLRNGD
jgi:uncharacterized protein HemX